ncbi:MAG: N-acetyltransferase [Ignisphaera sp.]|uniref:N-acetyltransferase n=1 Tax=Ignisphaera aggregans TaxID=334771 RepID=A0A7C4JJU8_9CREN
MSRSMGDTVNYVRIRPVTKADLDNVIAINIECLPEHYPYSFWLDHLEKWGNVFYVAEVDGEVVGYVLSRIEESSSRCHGRTSKIGHIVSVAVKEEYRARGIATALLSAVLSVFQTMHNIEEVQLEVRVSNYKAIRLYEKLGFIKAERIEGYYLDGEDSYLMVKNLSREPCNIKAIE